MKKFILKYRTILILSLVILTVAFIATRDDSAPQGETTSEESEQLQRVTAVTSSELQFENTFSQLGTVISDSTARITSNGSGRVTSVNFSQNDTVSAGTVVAVLDNRSERLALEDAKANLRAAQSAGVDADNSIQQAESGLRQAQRDLISTLQSSLNTRRQIVTSQIDPLYARPNGMQPGVRIGTGREVQTLNTFRINESDQQSAVETLLATLSINSELNDFIQVTSEYDAALENFEEYLNTIISTYRNIRDRDRGQQNEADEQIIKFTEAKSTIIMLRNDLDNRVSAVEQAKLSLGQARNNQASNQDSRLATDIARAESAIAEAEIRLEDTIIRAPISGDISELNVSLGQVLSPGMEIGKIINESNISIEAFITPAQRNKVRVGQEVVIGSATGNISRISSSIDESSGRVRITISPNERIFSIGETVRITITPDTTTESSTISIPLTGVVFSGTKGSVFIVDENSILQTTSITILSTQGRNVVAENTFESDSLIVTDARGLSEGQEVIVE